MYNVLRDIYIWSERDRISDLDKIFMFGSIHDVFLPKVLPGAAVCVLSNLVEVYCIIEICIQGQYTHCVFTVGTHTVYSCL